MPANPILNKSYILALNIVRFCRSIQQTQHEYVLTKQLLRSGTSIGANVEEAQQAQSKRDFASKFSIAAKEANETHYWLRLLRDSDIAQEQDVHPLLEQTHEIIRLLVAIVKTANPRPIEHSPLPINH